MSHVLNRSTVALTALAVAAGGALMGAPAQAAPTRSPRSVRRISSPRTDTADGGVQEFLAAGRPPEDDQRHAATRVAASRSACPALAGRRPWTTPGTAPRSSRASSTTSTSTPTGRSTASSEGSRLRRSGRLAQPGRPGLPRAPCSRTTSSPTRRRAPVPSPAHRRHATRVSVVRRPSKHGTLANWATRLQAATGKAAGAPQRRLLALRRRGRRRPHPGHLRPEPVRLHQHGQDQGERRPPRPSTRR